MGQEAETWLLGMERYFKIEKYNGNKKARLAIFTLQGRAFIWWEHMVVVRGINEEKIDWNQFQEYRK